MSGSKITSHITVMLVLSYIKLAVSVPLQASTPSNHVCCFAPPGSPQFPNQLPFLAQQLRMPFFRMVPHWGHKLLVDGVVVVGKVVVGVVVVDGAAVDTVATVDVHMQMNPKHTSYVSMMLRVAWALLGNPTHTSYVSIICRVACVLSNTHKLC